MLLMICIIVVCQAYVFTWMIPKDHYAAALSALDAPKIFRISASLPAILAALLVFALIIFLLTKRKRKNSNKPT
jgi:TRAP-type C4-dicarboxylate transport system permease small subunit